MREKCNLEELTARREIGLWLDAHDPILTVQQATRFLKAVGIALRYNATEGLPLASMYEAAMGTKSVLVKPDRSGSNKEADWQRRATELTSVLIAKREAVEVSVIAGRLVLVHKSLIPAIYALRTRGRRPDDLNGLSLTARRVYEVIGKKSPVSIGRVCAEFGFNSTQYPNPVYDAVAELQRELLIDRGPSSVTTKGIPYLTKEGIPYRIFRDTHSDVITEAKTLNVEMAAGILLLKYVNAAVFVGVRKLGSMFKLLLSSAEIRQTLLRLRDEKKLSFERLDKTEVVVIE